MMRKERLTILLTAKEKSTWVRAAKMRGISISALVRHAMAMEVKEIPDEGLEAKVDQLAAEISSMKKKLK